MHTMQFNTIVGLIILMMSVHCCNAMSRGNGGGMLEPMEAPSSMGSGSSDSAKAAFRNTVNQKKTQLNAQLSPVMQQMNDLIGRLDTNGCANKDKTDTTAQCGGSDPFQDSQMTSLVQQVKSIGQSVRVETPPQFCQDPSDAETYEACGELRGMNRFAEMSNVGSSPSSNAMVFLEAEGTPQGGLPSIDDLKECPGKIWSEMSSQDRLNLVPELYILGINGNLGVATAGSEAVFDMYKLDYSIFTYGGVTGGTTAQYTIGANAYLAAGWKGKNRNQDLAAAYSGCFYGVSISTPLKVPVPPPIGPLDVGFPLAFSCEDNGELKCDKVFTLGVSFGRSTNPPWKLPGVNVARTDYTHISTVDCSKKWFSVTCMYLLMVPAFGPNPYTQALGAIILVANQGKSGSG